MDSIHWPKKINQWTPHVEGEQKIAKIMEESTDELHEKQKYGKAYGRR